MSAILLPYTDCTDGGIDWPGFEAHVARTAGAGLVPAVNMDTGYVQLLDEAARTLVLERTRALCDHFVAGAHVADQEGDKFDLAGYQREVDRITERGGTPVVFPSWGLNALPGPEWLAAQNQVARDCDGFYSFELGDMFVPYGRIYDLDTYRGLFELPRCLGAKHSSLSRELEWVRLEARDQTRPDFRVLTGNDLAIDMVMYGSDYLLGLSTMAPDLFARRDQLWERGSADFFELNDGLQSLGDFTFRAPVPAYRHSAAQFLRLRGWIESDRTPEGASRRPASDLAVLATILERLGLEPTPR